MNKLEASIPNDLLIARNLIYEPCGFIIEQIQAEPESAEYNAYSFTINSRVIKFRSAKITPTKVGQFVTIWKRTESGPIAPFDMTDNFDLVVISCRKEENLGQFVFPKSVLADKRIISSKGKEGKRGFRVYPPWDEALNTQAKKSKAWQLKYFLKIPSSPLQDLDLAKGLYSFIK